MSTASDVLFTLPFSRLHEQEADEWSLAYLSRAGFSPEHAVKFWEKMAGLHAARAGAGAVPGAEHALALLSTHPSDEGRLEALRHRLGPALDEFRRQPQSQDVSQTQSAPSDRVVIARGRGPGPSVSTS